MINTLDAQVELLITQKADLRRDSQQQIKELEAKALEWETKFRDQFRELLRCGSEYEDEIAELKAETMKQEEEYKDRIQELENKNEACQAEIEVLKADVKTKDEKMAKGRISLQISEFLSKTPPDNLDLDSLMSYEEDEAILPVQKDNIQEPETVDRGTKGLLAIIKEKDTIIQTMESDKLRQETKCHQHQTECNNEIFRREKVQERLKASQVDVKQLDEIAESLEFLFNSTYVKIPMENLVLSTQWELEKCYNDVQRLHEERRAFSLARKQRIQEEEERENGV
ncbi:hypothetical protein IL306_011323 [Fusarium sp. DS 682]|nr:hypothetical protein IL306_011323 [Fusarium sp. DS 682]